MPSWKEYTQSTEFFQEINRIVADPKASPLWLHAIAAYAIDRSSWTLDRIAANPSTSLHTLLFIRDAEHAPTWTRASAAMCIDQRGLFGIFEDDFELDLSNVEEMDPFLQGILAMGMMNEVITIVTWPHTHPSVLRYLSESSNDVIKERAMNHPNYQP